jgi:hypothetical protein
LPKFNEQPTDKIIKREQKTNTGIYVTAGDIDHSDYDTKDWSDLQKDYTKMRDGHALISTTIDILKYPILMSEYRIESKNKEVEDYLYWVYDGLEKGFDYLRRHKMLALDFGVQMHEEIIKRGDKFNGKLTNRPIWYNPIQNETIDRFHYDEQTRFIGIKHEKRIPERNSEFIDIDIENLEYFTWNEEFNDVRGRSILRTVRLDWECELDILIAATNTIKRGSGIPIIYTKGEPSTTDETNIATVGRTICNMRNGYAAMNEERMRLDLVEPKGQQNILPLLEWLDRQIFFNTMSQFMTAGIGGNGSRAATSEHKSSYELAANFILQELETNFQKLTNRIMKMSYLAKVPYSEYPEFHFNAINQIDLTKVAGNIKTLIDSSAITKQREDEEYIREVFGMPKLEITTEIANPQEKPTSIFGEKDATNVKLLEVKHSHRNLTPEKQEFEDRVFSLESANEHFMTITEQMDRLLTRQYNELIDDMVLQLKKDRYKAISIRSSIIEQTIDEIMELYKKGYARGERDVKAEIRKIGGSIETSKLALSPKQLEKKRGIISRLIKTLFFNTKNSIENKMQVVTDAFLDKKGGLSIYLESYKDGSKTAKNNIKKNVEAGYIDGRGETLLDLKDNIETFFYSARLDKSLCDNCAPFDGSIMTYDEAMSEGLSFLHPVNSDCLGNDNCRCLLIAYSYGRK